MSAIQQGAQQDFNLWLEVEPQNDRALKATRDATSQAAASRSQDAQQEATFVPVTDADTTSVTTDHAATLPYCSYGFAMRAL